MYIPDHITKLKEKEVIVVGTNLLGNHAGGAALFAKQRFGLLEGIYEGISGQTYAFPTLDSEMQQLNYEDLEQVRNNFYLDAIQNPELTFYLTPVGLGIASYDISEIAPLFRVTLSNVIYPKQFIDYNEQN